MKEIQKPKDFMETIKKYKKEITFGSIIGGIATFCLARYKVSKSNQYLVRTGLGINDVLITKKGIQWPFQKFNFIDLTPRTISFDLHAMSREKIDFLLPGRYIIGIITFYFLF
jgi:hypothetical protein